MQRGKAVGEEAGRQAVAGMQEAHSALVASIRRKKEAKGEGVAAAGGSADDKSMTGKRKIKRTKAKDGFSRMDELLG